MRGGRHGVVILPLVFCIGVGCHQGEPDCVMPPCPLPVAIVATVTSAAGGAVAGLTLTLSGAAAGSAQCNAGANATLCFVPGLPGVYNLRFAAPGFQEKMLSVTVQGTTPACGCTSLERQELDVVLSPT
jgi:hypothetical protein